MFISSPKKRPIGALSLSHSSSAVVID